MNYTTISQVLPSERPAKEIEPMSVYRAFEQITDHRHKRGVRYPLVLVLTLVVLGKLAGMTTPEAIADWVRLRADGLRQLLPVKRASFPCAATYGNVLRTVNA